MTIKSITTDGKSYVWKPHKADTFKKSYDVFKHLYSDISIFKEVWIGETLVINNGVWTVTA